MRTRMLTAAALSALLAGSAVAQTTTPAPSNNNTATPPAASSPNNAPSGAIKMPSDTRANAATGTTTTAFIDAQDREQWLATTLIGTEVRGAADEDLGEVSDVLMDRNGNVVGAVIGVGGFLGIGQKDVAVPFNALELVRNGDDEKLVLRKSKEELKAAPEFKELAQTRTAPAASGANSGSSAPMTTPPASAR